MKNYQSLVNSRAANIAAAEDGSEILITLPGELTRRFTFGNGGWVDNPLDPDAKIVSNDNG